MSSEGLSLGGWAARMFCVELSRVLDCSCVAVAVAAAHSVSGLPYILSVLPSFRAWEGEEAEAQWSSSSFGRCCCQNQAVRPGPLCPVPGRQIWLQILGKLPSRCHFKRGRRSGRRECLPSKCKALGSNPRIVQNKTKNWREMLISWGLYLLCTFVSVELVARVTDLLSTGCSGTCCPACFSRMNGLHTGCHGEGSICWINDSVDFSGGLFRAWLKPERTSQTRFWLFFFFFFWLYWGLNSAWCLLGRHSTT
jgi:hypothetical protein